jgi:uncharacterized Zn-binding protein involved in type VI secretion
MPGVARVDTDVGSNRILVRGSTNVFVNNRGSCFAYDTVNARGVVVVKGSPNVFVNNKPIARESDALADGGVISSSSTNVFANN